MLLKKVAVLGAAGKMGRGISLLLLLEMIRWDLEANKNSGTLSTASFTLILIDSNEQALPGLKKYLKDQLIRHGEKTINALRGCYASAENLISNQEIINAYTETALNGVYFETDPIRAQNCPHIFEAIIENADIKGAIFSKIDAASSIKPWYFSNTSSIPIKVLMEKSGCGGRILGFHFYNPPPVQKLLEIIPGEQTLPELVKCGKEIALKLKKIYVFSKDAAGFIGNGHFMREIDYACRKVREFEKHYSLKQAVLCLNRLTQEFLIRPMGIFQLIDYVGLDVCQEVLKIMNAYLNESFNLTLIKSFLDQGVKGGQHEDGSQKNGIFYYERGIIRKIWEGGRYVDLPADILEAPLPECLPWKALYNHKDKEALLRKYFKALFESNRPGDGLAQEYLLKSREIARGLVADGVAGSIEDVNTVMINGFYHLYGPDSQWLPEIEKIKSSL